MSPSVRHLVLGTLAAMLGAGAVYFADRATKTPGRARDPAGRGPPLSRLEPQQTGLDRVLGRGPDARRHYVTREAGVHRIRVDALFDSVLYALVEGHDARGGVPFEDVPGASGESLEVFLTAGQRLTVVVDSNDPGPLGAWTLEVRGPHGGLLLPSGTDGND